MTNCNCYCRANCAGVSIVASIIVAIIAGMLRFMGIITLTSAFLWVTFGIAVVYLGLSLFSIYFCKVAATCASRFKTHRALFLLVLLFNFAVWFKVSTDIYIFFALFLCVPQEENEKNEDSIHNSLTV